MLRAEWLRRRNLTCQYVRLNIITVGGRTDERTHGRTDALTIDRDHNAALNILKPGLEQAHAEEQPLLVRQQISKFASRKQEARAFKLGQFTNLISCSSRV